MGGHSYSTAVEVGTCALCGQDLCRTDGDHWHPRHIQRPCPTDRPQKSDGFIRPGPENFLPYPKERKR